jgi:hypothetical protein
MSPEAKMRHVANWVDQALFSRNRCPHKCRSSGDKNGYDIYDTSRSSNNTGSFNSQFSLQREECRAPAATIILVDTAGRSCLRILIIPPSGEILSISAGIVKITMTFRSPRVTVVSGPLADPGRNQTKPRPGEFQGLGSATSVGGD